MTNVVVTEKILRELIHEALFNNEFSGWSSNDEGPAEVNPNVDPSVAVTDPVNPNFTPQNKIEFGIAIDQLVKNLPDTKMPTLYDTVKTAIDDDKKAEDEEEMKNKAMQNGTQQVEEAVRKIIRNVLADINPRFGTVSEAKPDPWKTMPPVTGPLPPVKKIPPGEHGGEYNRWQEKNKSAMKAYLGGKDLDAVEPELVDDTDGVGAGENPTPAAKRRAYKSTAIGGMSDVGGASLEQIATELGFSVAGAKQAVDKALEKARFLGGMDDDDREILVLTAMNDYIKQLAKNPQPETLKDAARRAYIDQLNSSGELTPADIQLMNDHPNIINDLDGFKEFEQQFMSNPIEQLKAHPEAIRDMDGFREFLHLSVKRARKSDQRLVDPVRDGSQNESKVPTLRLK